MSSLIVSSVSIYVAAVHILGNISSFNGLLLESLLAYVLFVYTVQEDFLRSIHVIRAYAWCRADFSPRVLLSSESCGAFTSLSELIRTVVQLFSLEIYIPLQTFLPLNIIEKC